MIDIFSKELDKEELITLHLGDETSESTEDIISPKHISDLLDIGEDEVLGIIDNLKQKDFLSEREKKEDENSSDYFLTEKGEKRSKKIWDEIKENSIYLIDEKDSIQLNLEYVPHILTDKSIIEILKLVDENKTLELRESGEEEHEFVGREYELEELTDILYNIEERNVKTIFISGDAGIGKTSLVNKLKNKASKEKFTFLTGKCFLENNLPYAPLKNILEKFLNIEEKSEGIKGVIDPPLSTSRKVQSQEMFTAQRKSLFYETKKYLRHLSKEKPLILFFDDLQWADSGTLHILEYLADMLKNEKVMIIGVYREGDVSSSSPLTETLRRMSRKKLYEEIKLKPLEKDNLKSIISDIISVESIPEDFVNRVVEKNNGNPLFVKETINQMVKEGIIDVETNKFPTEEEIIQIPDVGKEVIEKRVFELNDDTRKVLQLGSVIGKKIPLELLAEASEWNELDLLDKVEKLKENNIWKNHPTEESFLFTHDLFVDIIYDGIGKWLEKKYLHEKIADSIESVYQDDLEERYTELARHLKKAEKHEKAFSYFQKAGDKAERVYAHEDAIERYEEALYIANKTDEIEEKEVVSLLERLGEINNMVGNYEESRKYLDQALTKETDVESKRRIYRKIAESWFNQGEFEKTIDLTEEALHLVERDQTMLEQAESKETPTSEIDNTVEVCNLLSIKGWALKRIGEYEDMKETFFEELERAEDLEDKTSLAKAYHDLGSLERGKVKSEDCIDYLQKSIEIRKNLIEDEESYEEKYELSRSYNNLATNYLQLGELDKAQTYFEKALEIQRDINNKTLEVTTSNNLANLFRRMGELNKSEELLKESIDILKKIDYTPGHVLVQNFGGLISLERGEFDRALVKFEKALKISDEMGYKYRIGEAFNHISRIHIYKGNLDEAKDHLKKSYEIGKDMENNRLMSISLHLKGIVERLEGDIEKSIRHHNEAVEKSKRTSENISLFRNRSGLIKDYIAKDELDRAEEHLEKAKEENIETKETDSKLEMLEGIVLREKNELKESKKSLKTSLELSEELSKKYRIAEVKYELGKLKMSMNDEERAREYLEDAKQLFEEMSMEVKLKEAEDSLSDLI